MQPLLTVNTELEPFHQKLLAPSLQFFNQHQDKTSVLASILVQGSPSLRVVDYLVVQYAKARPILVGAQGTVPSDLWLQYRQMLSATGKRYAP